MRLTKIGVKTIILRQWGVSGRSPLRDADVCQRICAETGWQAPAKKQRQSLMERYVAEVLKVALLRPEPRVAPAVRTRKARQDFYRSDEWRALRYQALKLHGARCQCCGRGPRDGVALHVDHIKPRAKYPELELILTNLQVLCEDCNMGKSARDDTDWRPALNE